MVFEMLSAERCWWFHTHALIISASCPESLPVISWWHPMNGPGPQLFGFNAAYYNPNHTPNCPHILADRCLAIYGVEPPFPQVPTCEINQGSIEYLLLLPCTPGEAAQLLAEKGLAAVENAAIWEHHFHVHAVPIKVKAAA